MGYRNRLSYVELELLKMYGLAKTFETVFAFGEEYAILLALNFYLPRCLYVC